MAIIAYKNKKLAVIICLALVAANMAVNISYVYKYNLKAGFLHVNNYYLLQSIIAKPWTKLQNLGQGVIMALIYRRIIEYRKEVDTARREALYPIFHKLHTYQFFGGRALCVTGAGIFGLSLVVNWPYNGNPT